MKVLIISTAFFGYQDSVASAFANLGHQVVIETYDSPIHPFRGLLKWRHKFSCNKVKLRKRAADKYNKYIIGRFDRIRPDLVFILNGEILHAQTLDTFRKQSKVAVWMYDALSRYPDCREHIDHVDAFFCYECEDVKSLSEEGKKAWFLPQACDESVYYIVEGEKELDILFVGNLYKYYRRVRYIKRVIERFRDKKITVYGVYKPYYKNTLKWLFREKRSIFKNKNIPPSEVNRLYNKARVVLNIHHETQQNGANPKVYEICGSGAYQICDANPYIESIFPHGEVGLYHNEEELIALIDRALTHDQCENAKKAHEIIYREHTFLHRIENVLKIMGSQGKIELKDTVYA
ncbi:MAG: glycosyltransferase [Culturomica sp.]|jgi:spore maturation protein CgeB|nr:glycosyltransferase [Culturomica sp.]